jgi:hypothetical protein
MQATSISPYKGVRQTEARELHKSPLPGLTQPRLRSKGSTPTLICLSSLLMDTRYPYMPHVLTTPPLGGSQLYTALAYSSVLNEYLLLLYKYGDVP